MGWPSGEPRWPGVTAGVCYLSVFFAGQVQFSRSWLKAMAIDACFLKPPGGSAWKNIT